MNEDLIQKAMQMFDTSEKWNAFCTLMDLAKYGNEKNGEIQNRWWKKLQIEVYNRELQELAKENPSWDIYVWNNWDIKWFLRGEDEKRNGYFSLVIHFHAWQNATLRVYYENLNSEKVNKLLASDTKFDAIKMSFDRNNGNNDGNTLGSETGNFIFETPFDKQFPDNRTLSWFAGNKTEQFANQIIEKVRKFQTPEMTALFKEINEKCRN